MIIGLVLLSMAFLLAFGIPVGFALGSSAYIGMLLEKSALIAIPQIMHSSVESFIISAVPLFILMSQILLKSRVGEDFYDVTNKWVRHFPGGLAVATILTCAMFAAISGSSTATAISIGIVAIPSMISRGYPPRFVYGIVACGGTIGILIPPSIPMILYGSITGESVGRLFIAGILPGIAITLVTIIFIVIYALKDKTRFPKQPPASWTERFKILYKNLFGFMIPAVIIGGIYTGIFTPTEAAAIGVTISFILGYFIYRRLKFSDLYPIMMDTVKISSMILTIIMGAILFGHVITSLRLPQIIAEFITSQDFKVWTFLIFMNILLIFMGDFLEVASIMLITLPVFYSVILQMGIDPIWFAVVMVVNMELALMTPPVGLNLFVIMGLDKNATLYDVMMGAAPFMLILVFMLIIIMLFPQLSLWLPSLM